MTLECTFDRQRRTKDINIPRRHLLLLCFGWILEFAKFCRAKNKTSSKRLFYICIFPTSLTSLRKYRRGKRGKDSNLINRTKIYSAIFSDVSWLLKKQTRNRLSVYLPWCKFFRTHHRPDGKIYKIQQTRLPGTRYTPTLPASYACPVLGMSLACSPHLPDGCKNVTQQHSRICLF